MGSRPRHDISVRANGLFANDFGTRMGSFRWGLDLDMILVLIAADIANTVPKLANVIAF